MLGILNQEVNEKNDNMILSVFNNTNGGGKSTIIYTLLIYMKALNRKRDINLYDLYDDSVLFKTNDSINNTYRAIENYGSLNENSETEIYNTFSYFYGDRNLHFFNSVGKVKNSDSMLLLYSKFIIVPIISSYYYLNNIYDFILLVNNIYVNIFIPNEEIVASVKEFPTLIFVPMHTAISENTKDIIKKAEYGNGLGKMHFIENVYPFLDYGKIVNYNSDEDSINKVNENLSKFIFSL